jgi:hypothetical protein
LKSIRGGLRVQGPEDGRPVGPVEILDDVRDIRGVQLVELAHGDVQLEVPFRVAGQGLDEFPGRQPLREPVGEKPVRSGVDRPHPTEAAEDAAQAEIDMDEEEFAMDDQKVDIVDSLDLGPGGVDDLLVEEVFPEQDLPVPDLEAGQPAFRAGLEDGGAAADRFDPAPVEGEGRLLAPVTDNEGVDLREELAQLDLEIGQPAVDFSLRVGNGIVQQVG